ncbi:MAG: YdaS family helix-turn-helix protein [Thermoguttaceae bacterium]
MDTSNPVSIAVSLVGLQPLAKAVGVSYQMIRKYERTSTSAERVLDLSRATGWRVTPHALRPDLYPNAPDALPAEVAEALAWGTWPTLVDLAEQAAA